MEKIEVILGFDFGKKYIGVATGNSKTKTATPLTSLKAKDGIPNWDEIQKLIDEWQPITLVVGLPLNMDNSWQHMTNCAKKFSNRLYDKYKIPVKLVDEKLSTWEAKKQNIKNFDKLNAEAAAILVKQYLFEL